MSVDVLNSGLARRLNTPVSLERRRSSSSSTTIISRRLLMMLAWSIICRRGYSVSDLARAPAAGSVLVERPTFGEFDGPTTRTDTNR